MMMVQTSFAAPHQRHDSAFIESVVSHLPNDLQKPVAKHYASIYGSGEPTSEQRRNANLYLLGLDVNRKAGHSRILLQDREAIAKKAERLALEATKRIHAGGYPLAVQLLETHQLNEPLSQDDAEAGKVARVCCVEWWTRQLTKQSERDCEHFAIQSGFVRRGVSAYISKALLKHIEAKQKSSIEAMENMEAINTETGETLDMQRILKGSMANPEVRRIELMVRCRGFEDYAEQAGHTAAFYTITAPSKYHATAWNTAAKKAHDNKKYSGVTPRETQAYLVALWSKIRAKLKRDDLNVYGFRVCEPHHDGTPHWHLLLFMNPAHEKAVTRIMKEYALAEDGNERGADKHRFTVELIDSSKGSATGYIAKYISKNINGTGIGEDHESGLDASSGADRVRAWASLWGIRQFQMIGGAPVGVWRELRRIEQCPDGLLNDAMNAADAGDWMQYLMIQGGADADRKDQPLKCYTVERIDTETGKQLTNKYGEIVDKVEGVSLLDLDSVQTRLHEWIIQRKPDSTAESNPDKLVKSSGPIVFDRPSAAPRSSVNNCTQYQSGGVH